MKELFPSFSGLPGKLKASVWLRAALDGAKPFLFILPLWAAFIFFSEPAGADPFGSAAAGITLIIFLFPIGFISGPLAARRAETWPRAAWLGVASGFIPAAVNFAIAASSIFSTGEGLKFVAIGFFCGLAWLVCGGLGGLAASVFTRRREGGARLQWKPAFAATVIIASLALLYYTVAIESGDPFDTLEAQRRACAAKAQAALNYSGVTESHKPGSGYIKVKATFVSKIPLTLGGSAKTVWNDTKSPLFYFVTDLPKTKLEPGVPRELELHLVANPGYPGVPALAADGPYDFREVYGSVHGFEATEEMSDWCPLPLIKNLRTGPYKAADFARLVYRESKAGFSYPGREFTKEQLKDLTGTAKGLLKEAEEEQRRAKGSKPRS